jgi:hypothetical protein
MTLLTDGPTTLREEKTTLPDGIETTFSTNQTGDQRWYFVLAVDPTDTTRRAYAGWYDVTGARRALVDCVRDVRNQIKEATT